MKYHVAMTGGSMAWACLLLLAMSGTRYAADAGEGAKASGTRKDFNKTPYIRNVDRGRINGVNEAVRAEMAAQGVIGCAIGILFDYEIVYLNAYGLADREGKRPMRNTTVVNWASNSKPLAALRAMQLVEKGRMKLDDDVRRHIPEYPISAQPILLHHLLAHQSGIPHYSNGTIIPGPKNRLTYANNLNPRMVIQRFLNSPPVCEPGERYSYSTYAYILLSAVVQQVGKKAFDEQIQEHIARPLKMATLQLDLREIKPDWAAGYMKRGDAVVRMEDTAHYWKHGGGGYKSSIVDFALWAQALSRRDRLLKKESYARMYAPRPLRNGASGPYGLGMRVDAGDRLRVHHGGSQNEATTYLEIYPEEGFGIVVMTNSNHAKPEKIADAVQGAFAAAPREGAATR